MNEAEKKALEKVRQSITESGGNKTGPYIGVLLGTVVTFAIWIASFGLIAYIFSINPDKNYGWFAGLFHGGWAPIKYITSFIYDGWILKAPIHTTMYNVFWWIGIIISCLGIFNKFIVNTVKKITTIKNIIID